MPTVPLTDAKAKGLKPQGNRYRATDGGGMYLEVMPTGAKFWRLKYRHEGHSRTVTLGEYPGMSLAEARHAREDTKAMIRRGRDPNPEVTARAEAKAAASPSDGDDIFRNVAERWMQKRVQEEAAGITIAKYRSRLQRPLLKFGDRRMRDIPPRDVLDMLREVEAAKQYETAKRIRTLLSQIFVFAIAEGTASTNPTAGLDRALVSARATHHAGVKDPAQVGWLMRMIRGYDGMPQTRAGLLLSAYCFLRPGETRGGLWEEIDWQNALWRIPGPRMKGRHPRDHIVPLSSQALAVLRWIRPLTGGGKLILSQKTDPTRPISVNTMNAALTNLGVLKSVHVPHGFRTTASTNLNEALWNRDWVETQLHHVHGDKVRGAYNAAVYLEPRRVMMQVYADWLDAMSNLPEGAEADRSLLQPPGELRAA